MHKFTPYVLFFMLFALSVNAEPKDTEKIESLTTADGKTYLKVTVREIKSNGIRILHESGAATVPFAKLPPELQERFKSNLAPAKEQNRTSSITLKEACSPVPITEWAGHKFIFIPLSEYDRSKGYIVKKGPNTDISYIPYKKYLGKYLTVLKVEKERGSFPTSYNITLNVLQKNSP